MKRTTTAVLAVTALLVACADGPTQPGQGPIGAALGNGFPSGAADYHLNIIGVPKDKTATMDNNDGHRIFVQLNSTNTVTSPGGKNNQLAKGGGNDQNHIYLCNSTNGENDVVDPRCDAWIPTHTGEFGVIDANATDGDGAIFGLPDPCADALASTACTPTYSIWARVPGNQKGNAIITTCADETGAGFDGTDDVWCGSNSITLSKATARKAIEVTNSLLRMTITVDGTVDAGLATCLGTSTTGLTTINVYIFDNCFENYFWNYDNNGLKHLELRFYAS